MPAFLLDENVNNPNEIISRCKTVGIDVIRVHQVDLNRTDDGLIFQYAMEWDYVIVTGNIRDFRPEQKKWIEAGNEFPGAIYLSSVHYRSVEQIVDRIIIVAQEYEQTELREWWV